MLSIANFAVMYDIGCRIFVNTMDMLLWTVVMICCMVTGGYKARPSGSGTHGPGQHHSGRSGHRGRSTLLGINAWVVHL